jgi:gamma-glutamylcyclotransferase (GGCT)/AIG2-like uncharacterized protein YtfP
MDGNERKEWYFAYGSNLCVEQMIQRTGPIGDEEFQHIALLPGYRLVFNMRGGDGRVYANIIQPGDGVLGVLYHCRQTALARLDVYEEGYDRRRILVMLESGALLKAMAYFAKPECTTDEGVPSAEYLEIILQGARRQSLPARYIALIEERARTGC